MAKDGEGQKRLQPRMTRGFFRFQLVLWMLALNLIWQLAARWNEPPWGWSHYASVAILAGSVAVLASLLYLRRRDGHLWAEEEARRADWDRRGRRL